MSKPNKNSHVTVSDGNSKLGAIPNISLMPCRDCGKDVPCARGGCYAVNILRYAPSAKRAWEGNSRTARNNPEAYFTAVRTYLVDNAPTFFRWHVAGDFLNQHYTDEVKAIAREYPEVRFLAFTKRHDLSFAGRPENLTIVFSMWPGWQPNMRRVAHLPKAYMQNGSEDRVPKDAIHCPGNCEHCGMCWNLPKLGKSVVFQKH